MRTYSGSSKSLFRYMFIKSKPAHFALGGGQCAVDEDFGGGEVCGRGTNVIFDGDFAAADRDADPMGIWFLRTEVGDHLDVCGSLVLGYVASVNYEHSVLALDIPVSLH